jgi:hypothetical protein
LSKEQVVVVSLTITAVVVISVILRAVLTR